MGSGLRLLKATYMAIHGRPPPRHRARDVRRTFWRRRRRSRGSGECDRRRYGRSGERSHQPCTPACANHRPSPRSASRRGGRAGARASAPSGREERGCNTAPHHAATIKSRFVYAEQRSPVDGENLEKCRRVRPTDYESRQRANSARLREARRALRREFRVIEWLGDSTSTGHLWHQLGTTAAPQNRANSGSPARYRRCSRRRAPT